MVLFAATDQLLRGSSSGPVDELRITCLNSGIYDCLSFVAPWLLVVIAAGVSFCVGVGILFVAAKMIYARSALLTGFMTVCAAGPAGAVLVAYILWRSAPLSGDSVWFLLLMQSLGLSLLVNMPAAALIYSLLRRKYPKEPELIGKSLNRAGVVFMVLGALSFIGAGLAIVSS